MAYYDPIGWIAQDDRLVSDIEQAIRAPKQANPKQTGTGKSFLPPSAIELDIVIKGTSEILRLTEWEDRQGKLFINLALSGRFFRKGHFNQQWHHNPNGQDIPPPHHMHFPTDKYPNLERPPNYAYTLIAETDYLSALVEFCDETNIEMYGVSIPLWRR